MADRASGTSTEKVNYFFKKKVNRKMPVSFLVTSV